jgi:hypothetical protein
MATVKVRYVSPNGCDANDGDSWKSALKYLKTAWQQLGALGGGTIYFADGTSVSEDGHGLAVDGAGLIPWSVGPMPVRVVGVREANSSLFGWEPAARSTPRSRCRSLTR